MYLKLLLLKSDFLLDSRINRHTCNHMSVSTRLAALTTHARLFVRRPKNNLDLSNRDTFTVIVVVQQ